MLVGWGPKEIWEHECFNQIHRLDRLTISYPGSIPFESKRNTTEENWDHKIFTLRQTKVELTGEDIKNAASKAKSRGKTYFALIDGKKRFR